MLFSVRSPNRNPNSNTVRNPDSNPNQNPDPTNPNNLNTMDGK